MFSHRVGVARLDDLEFSELHVRFLHLLEQVVIWPVKIAPTAQGEVYTKIQPCSASQSTLVGMVHPGLQDGQSVPTVPIASVATRG